MEDNNKIIKGCYENRYGTQKYSGSVFQASFEELINDIIQETRKKMFNELRNICIADKIVYLNFKEMEKRYLQLPVKKNKHEDDVNEDK